MVRGLFKLTWLEIKIFMREPLGFIGTFLVPIIMFVFLGRSFASSGDHSPQTVKLIGEAVPILVTLFVSINAALSLVAVISIYREGGILRRLRATPLRPGVILGAHVLVKLLFTAMTLGAIALAGRRLYPVAIHFHPVAYSLAVLLSTLAILSLGFVIASIVPTARFAQPIGSMILYPMIALSGLFAPLAAMPRPWAMLGSILPITHAVALIRGAWVGAGWLEQLPHVGALVATIVVCLVISDRVFRWE
jgi:ABC-2 type transport system permease protein